MHMADGLVSPAVAGTMFALSAIAAGYSVKKVRSENNSKKIPVMGVMGAFIFAAQMVNFTIPGTGSSGHLAGGMLLTAMLGPSAGFLTLTAVLMIQALLFADGGLLALGCNIWNMAFYSCSIGSWLIWRMIMKNGMTNKKIALASIIGSIISLQLGAFSVSLETYASGITELPLGLFAGIMQPIHLAIGLADGLITSAVLCFIYKARPDILWTGQEEKPGLIQKSGKLSLKNTLIIVAVSFTLIGGGLSLIASSNPDGLEWSINKTAGSENIKPRGEIYTASEKIQSKTAFLPDYSFKNSHSLLGKSLSGIFGSAAVISFCILACYAFRFFRKRAK